MIDLEARPVSYFPLQLKATVGNNNQSTDSERLIKLKKCCADMESLFISSLLKALRKTISESDLLPKSTGRNVYSSMFDQQVSIFLSQGQGIGLAQMLYEQMLRKNNNELLKDGDKILTPSALSANQEQLDASEKSKTEKLQKKTTLNPGGRTAPVLVPEHPDKSMNSFIPNQATFIPRL
ncbi:MAG: rod-binding protein [Deltaproteobacteria bacterium]|nr:rod-binding protein [Deltaproteobacteria bacterium]